MVTSGVASVSDSVSRAVSYTTGLTRAVGASLLESPSEYAIAAAEDAVIGGALGAVTGPGTVLGAATGAALCAGGVALSRLTKDTTDYHGIGARFATVQAIGPPPGRLGEIEAYPTARPDQRERERERRPPYRTPLKLPSPSFHDPSCPRYPSMIRAALAILP